MSKYVPKGVARLIDSYKTRHFPYSRSDQYRDRLVELAAQLRYEKYGEDHALDLTVPDLRYYVYVYLDTRKPKSRYTYVCPSGKEVAFSYPPYYVGKGRGDRTWHHLWCSTRKHADLSNHNRLKVGVTKAILQEGQKPEIMIIPTRLSENLAYAFEIDLIAGIGRKDKLAGPLTNLTNGGESCSGSVHSKIWTERMSKSMKLVWASKSKTEREVIAAKIARGNVAAWSHKTKEDIKKRRDKRRQTESSRPKIVCPYCEFGHSRVGMMKTFHFDNCKFKSLSPEDRRIRLHGTQEEKRALTKSLQRQRAISRPEVICPHCDLQGRGPVMRKWHFDNCKRK